MADVRWLQLFPYVSFQHEVEFSCHKKYHIACENRCIKFFVVLERLLKSEKISVMMSLVLFGLGLTFNTLHTIVFLLLLADMFCFKSAFEIPWGQEPPLYPLQCMYSCIGTRGLVSKLHTLLIKATIKTIKPISIDNTWKKDLSLIQTDINWPRVWSNRSIS